jgi:cell division protein FtsL
MKQINYTVIIAIFMISCASIQNKSIEGRNPIIEINDTIKDKYCALNDFFDTKIKDHSKKIVVMGTKK